MINLLRTYSPFNVLWLAVLLIVLRVGYLLGAPATVPMAVLEPFVQTVLPFGISPTVATLLSVSVAGLLVLLQAVLLNTLINFHNLLGRPSFLPGGMYIVLSSLFTPFLILSAPLLCNFAVLWMLFKMLQLYQAEDAKSTAYDLGFLAAIGTLIYLPFTYMLLGVWIAFIILRPFNLREWVASLIGYITVFFFIAVFYYLANRLDAFYKIWSPLGAHFETIRLSNRYDYLILIPVAVILVLGLFKLQENFFKSYVLIRKAFQLLTVLTLIAAASYYVRQQFGLSHFALCVVPMAIFSAYYFLYARMAWFYETLFFVLIAGIVYFQFNTF